MITRKCACGCGSLVTTTETNAKRGWGRFASKSCKAKAQERRTGQYKAYTNRKYSGDEELFSNAHQFSNEE
jgi:hypothetical protein